MMSDVPLGAFLSGGIDSSLIVALMQKISNGATRTFSIGFGEERFNEAPYAAKVAKALGTQHSELYISAENCMAAVPLLPEMYDEPFADSSQIPTYLVSKMARKHVTVALSGDAGDEVFGGYNRYTWLPKVWRYAETIPDVIRKVFGRSSAAIPPNLRRPITKLIAKQLKLSPQSLDLQMIKALRVLTSVDVNDAYLQVISSGLPNNILSEDWTSANRTTPKLTSIGLNLIDTLMLNDQKMYLSDDILVKLDRASMYASLEARAVFLDHELMELLWTIPTEQKIIGDRRKIILHDILGSYLPKHLIDRPKMGFALPIGDWLRGGLKEWCMDLLATNHLQSNGIFNATQVDYLLKRHMSGQGDHQLELWPILMFQAWKTHHRISA
jgi:asparagine synthase (glutamine-hydrolysing)